MRIALDADSEVGQRVARIFLGDDRCETLVMINSGWVPADSRVVSSRDLTGSDVVVSDGTTPLTSLIGRSSVANVPLVTWPDIPASTLGPASIPVIVGANVGSTLADSLLSHPSSQPTRDDSVQVAWTEPGKPQRNGTPIPFPDPVGMAWSEEKAEGRFVANRDDEWAGVTTIVEGPQGKRIVGVADHGAHLEALTLAAVAFAAANGSFDPGIQSTATAREAILSEARNLELDVAVWRSIPGQKG
ncbi:MAG: hypothetical protein BMS9Abin12_0828 [Acidimicrobiia bacterium]|nr:MAG: hypothetical protein BMS9Abin12_0828 [Acidimicrobiia bacterium]